MNKDEIESAIWSTRNPMEQKQMKQSFFGRENARQGVDPLDSLFNQPKKSFSPAAAENNQGTDEIE